MDVRGGTRGPDSVEKGGKTGPNGSCQTSVGYPETLTYDAGQADIPASGWGSTNKPSNIRAASGLTPRARHLRPFSKPHPRHDAHQDRLWRPLLPPGPSCSANIVLCYHIVHRHDVTFKGSFCYDTWIVLFSRAGRKFDSNSTEN